jgi:hypothetical protein
MSAKTTIVLAAAAALLGLAWLLASPPPGRASKAEDSRLVTEFRPEQVEAVSILRKEGPEIRAVRAKDVAGEYWRLEAPVDHPADPASVQQLLFALDRLLKTASFEPGRPEAAPPLTGLDDPRLKVSYRGAGAEVRLRFGKAPSTNAKAVFVQREDDPRIYLADVDTFEHFNKPAWQYRSKAVLRFPTHAVVGLEVEHKFTRKTSKDDPETVEYERSVLERVDQGADRGWWLAEPYRERLDDHKAGYLVRALGELEASEFQPESGLAGKGLDQPQVRISIRLNGVETPVRIAFGGAAEGGRRRWVHAPGSKELARIDEALYEKLPVQRKHFRRDALFEAGQEQVRTLEVSAAGLGGIRIERREMKREGEPVPEVSWEVLEPAGLKVDKERLEVFVANLLVQRIQDFLGPQDSRLARLDPADATTVLTTKDGRTYRHHFGLGVDGFARKEGVDEVFTVRPELVKILRRLELNFLHPEIFNVPRDAIREFSFESKDPGRLEPLFYRLRRDPARKAWRFVDPANASRVPDEDRLGGLLTMLNYIKAETFIDQDAETSAKHRLDPAKAPARLTLWWEGGPEGGADFLISADLSDKPTKPVYYARRADQKAVFQINALLVETLKRAP